MSGTTKSLRWLLSITAIAIAAQLFNTKIQAIAALWPRGRNVLMQGSE